MTNNSDAAVGDTVRHAVRTDVSNVDADVRRAVGAAVWGAVDVAVYGAVGRVVDVDVWAAVEEIIS